jgi:hypothetical protein
VQRRARDPYRMKIIVGGTRINAFHFGSVELRKWFESFFVYRINIL